MRRKERGYTGCFERDDPDKLFADKKLPWDAAELQNYDNDEEYTIQVRSVKEHAE